MSNYRSSSFQRQKNLLCIITGFLIATLPLTHLKHISRPISLMAAAPRHQESKLIKLMSAFEANFPPRNPPTELLHHRARFSMTTHFIDLKDERISYPFFPIAISILDYKCVESGKKSNRTSLPIYRSLQFIYHDGPACLSSSLDSENTL